MSMYADYFKEMQQYETLEIPERGFIMWHIFDNGGEDKELHLAHMYVKPEYRRTGLAQELASKACAIGKEKGCKYASCVVSLPDKTPERATRLIRIYNESGFNVAGVVGGQFPQVIMKKDLV